MTEQPIAESEKDTAITPQENATETATEQPAEESRYDFIQDLEPGKEEVKKPTEETEKDKPKDESEAEKPTEEVKPEYTFEQDKILIKSGDKTDELIKFDFGDGAFGYIPATKKADNGFLRQADYSKKTQELTKQKQEFDEAKKQFDVQRQSVDTLAYVDFLGKQPLKPIVDPLGDLGTENGQELMKDGKPTGKIVYTNTADYADAQEKYDKWNTDHLTLKAKQESVKEQNLKMLNDFKTKHGDEVYTKVIEEAGKYINPYVFKELEPYSESALELIRKGLMYETDIEAKDKEIEKKINDAVLAKVKELEGKAPVRTPEVKQTQMATDKGRYNFINELN